MSPCLWSGLAGRAGPGCGGDQRHRLQPCADSPRGEWPFLLTSEELGTELGSLVGEKGLPTMPERVASPVSDGPLKREAGIGERWRSSKYEGESERRESCWMGPLLLRGEKIWG